MNLCIPFSFRRLYKCTILIHTCSCQINFETISLFQVLIGMCPHLSAKLVAASLYVCMRRASLCYAGDNIIIKLFASHAGTLVEARLTISVVRLLKSLYVNVDDS